MLMASGTMAWTKKSAPCPERVLVVTGDKPRVFSPCSLRNGRKSGVRQHVIRHVHEGDGQLQNPYPVLQLDKVLAEDCWRKMAAHHRSLSEGGALTDCYICLEPIDGGISRISSETNNRVGDIGFWAKLCFMRFQSSIKTSTSCVSQSGWLLAKVSSKSSSGRETVL